jgi:hypothetical protein
MTANHCLTDWSRDAYEFLSGAEPGGKRFLEALKANRET